MFTRSITLAILTCLLSFQVYSQEKENQGNEAELLLLLIHSMDKNMEAIHTWKGETRIERVRAYDNGEPEIQSGYAMEFALDRQQHALRWNKTLYNRKYANNKRLFVSPDKPELSGGIVKNQSYSNYTPSFRSSAKGERLHSLIITQTNNWRLNSHIELADDEFSLDTLGVLPGTPVSDKIQGTRYKYGDPGTEQPKADPSLKWKPAEVLAEAD